MVYENGLIFEDFYHIAEAFNYMSSVSLKVGNKMQFLKWDSSKPSAIDNIIVVSKNEANKHFDLRNSEDLLKFYKEETYTRVTSILKKLNGNKN